MKKSAMQGEDLSAPASPAPVAPLLARIPPPLWALFYLFLAALLNIPFPIPILHIPLLGGLVALAGAALALTAIALFLRAGTPVNPAAPVNTALVTSGPFRYTRNPMYLAILLATAGLALWVGTLPYLLVPLAVFFTNDAVVIPYEEEKMERQFGDDYRSYKAKVRRWV